MENWIYVFIVVWIKMFIIVINVIFVSRIVKMILLSKEYVDEWSLLLGLKRIEINNRGDKVWV